MEQEEYIVDGHRVTHSVHLGDREIFLAVQQDAPLPFYVGYMEVSYELGLARFSGIEGTTEYTGEHTYIRRTDVMGAVKPDRLPGWAKEKAAALRQDYQREKAAEKQRLEEFLTARREKKTSETLRRPRAAQTRGKKKGGER